MAIATGSKVRVKTTGNGFAGRVPIGQPQVWGRVVDDNGGAGPMDVLFDNGNLVEDIPAAQLDEITDGSDAGVADFTGKIVRPQILPPGSTAIVDASAEYDAEVVAVFSIAGGADQLITKTLKGCVFRQYGTVGGIAGSARVLRNR